MPTPRHSRDESTNAAKSLHPLLIGVPVLFLVVLAFIVGPKLFKASYNTDGKISTSGTVEHALQKHVNESEDDINVIGEEDVANTEESMASDYPRYIPTPEPLKAIYMTQCVAGTPSFRADLIKLIDETELNAIIIDVKDFSGGLGFVTDNPTLAPYISDRCRASDMEALLSHLKEKNIYTIARITVFQDPLYTTANPEVGVKKASSPNTLWSDNKGLHFVDVSAKKYWEYIVLLSKEVHKMGFDELNYDYVRFPSDGPMKDILFPHSGTMPKAEALERFFKYLHSEVQNPDAYPKGVAPPKTSVDIFGMTATNYDDLNIGQVLERTLPYFDYVAPMVYPSHYPNGWNGFQNPNNHVYDVIFISMKTAAERAVAKESRVQTLDGKPIMKTVTTTEGVGSSTKQVTKEVATGMYTKEVHSKLKLRTWIQDFDYGGNYDVAEVKAQMQATYDAGLTSWMIWAPSNRYTEGALKRE